MASVSNTYNNYVLNGAYTSLYKTSNPKASNTQDDVFISQEQSNYQDNNQDVKQKIKTLLSEPYTHPTPPEFIATLEDGNTQLENKLKKIQYLKDNVSMPSKDEFEISKNILLDKVYDILQNVYKTKKEDSKEFQEMLNDAKFLMNALQDSNISHQNLITTLKLTRDNTKNTNNQELIETLLNNTEDTNQKGQLYIQQGSDSSLADSFESFFKLAEFYNVLPKEQKESIQKDLQTTQRYLYTLGGEIGNSYKIDDFTVSWKGNDILSASSFSFKYHSTNELLTSLSSNLDSTQSFFDMLEQREKLEKENQELQNKRGLNLTNNPYIETKSDGILKEVLKSKDKEIRA
ncbi:hypothetical protein B6S12_01015 [Helicobacter valdiviensis]|uniref:Uncharacterized protein n=1 Tax=Helicobacter valdiviensis TaxID=1458358 RepID=A0A2W6MWX2_9HELI|nr:hypothetical protein [Helicobacter valdiviensis]PZT48907.1 hypothetical protein B6S12_01015 [Helicobacter valdiviensis]